MFIVTAFVGAAHLWSAGTSGATDPSGHFVAAAALHLRGVDNDQSALLREILPDVDLAAVGITVYHDADIRAVDAPEALRGSVGGCPFAPPVGLT